MAAPEAEVPTTEEMSAAREEPAVEAPAAGEDQAPPPATTATTVPALYVGDLPENAKEDHLFDAFSTVGAVTSVRVCRDNATSSSLRYGYVNYFSQADAMTALEKMNHSFILDKEIRVMWSNRDPDARRSGVGNVFIKNFSDHIDNVILQELFSKFGEILSCKVARNEDGTSRGYGFVQFAAQESADIAIENLNNSYFEGKQLHVAHFVKKSERSANNDDKYTNLYMKNLDDDMTEELIKLKFSQFGPIISVKIMKRDDGTSKGFGFVSFKNPESAKKAKEAMNGMALGSKTLYVARAQKKAERKQYLQLLHEEKRNEIITKSNASFILLCYGSNVYIKNISDKVDDDTLRERFDEFGNITSVKIMRDDKGISKGFGFVCYATPDEANCAVGNMRGVMFYGKPLYVAIAQRKEDRKARLEQRFAEFATRSGAASPQFGHAKYIPADVMTNGMAIHHGDHVSSGNDPFIELLAAAPPDKQRDMLGNRIYPLVQRYYPHLASKITGMLLELLLELDTKLMEAMIHSPDMLSAKMNECVQLLQKQPPTKTEDQEALHPGFVDSTGVSAN
ncbi:hypothetical protein ACQ4PT_000719 [Festuca glaucescens]